MSLNIYYGDNDNGFDLNSDDFDGGIENITVIVSEIIDGDGDERDDEFYIDVPLGTYLAGDSIAREFIKNAIEDIVDYAAADFIFVNADDLDRGVNVVEDDFFR